MCGRGRLFPDTEQPPQNAPHAAGRTPHHDLHALTSCHASTPRRRRSAETPPETSGTPPETRRRSGCPVPAPARRSPETSFRRHIVARYIPPLLQYMKERTRRAWRGGTSGTPSPTGAQQKQRGAPQGAPRVFRPCVAQTEEGYIRRLVKAGTAGVNYSSTTVTPAAIWISPLSPIVPVIVLPLVVRLIVPAPPFLYL